MLTKEENHAKQNHELPLFRIMEAGYKQTLLLLIPNLKGSGSLESGDNHSL